MSTLLQINVTANWGSTGKIAEGIGQTALLNGWDSWIAYGRGNPKSESNLIRIGNDTDMRVHGLKTRLFDNHGLASGSVTKRFIEKIKDLKPDIIHLHNIHGYYLNYKILFEYIKSWGGPVVWTLHDCWPFTGHCAYYDFAKCDRWKYECHNCPQLKSYPASFFADRSRRNYLAKKEAFQGCDNLTLVPVSDWLHNEINKSFLSEYPIKTIHNGIDLSIFNPASTEKKKYSILGVASVWEPRKGLNEFIKLRKLLPEEYRITLIGLNDKQISRLPIGIDGIRRTENIHQLVDYYSDANVFVNPTFEDNFPTTNIEALACGTPVITYRTGGSPEAIDSNTGLVVEKNDITGLVEAIKEICNSSKDYSSYCRQRAMKYFDSSKCFKKYIELYNSLIP